MVLIPVRPEPVEGLHTQDFDKLSPNGIGYGLHIPSPNGCGYLRLSRRAIHTVASRITSAPAQVEALGTSENTSQPNSEAQTSSRKRSDCVAEMSAM